MKWKTSNTAEDNLGHICILTQDSQFQNGAVCQWLLSWVKHVSPGRLHSSPFFWRLFPFRSFFLLRFSLNSCSLPSTSWAASLLREGVGMAENSLCLVNNSTSSFLNLSGFYKGGRMRTGSPSLASPAVKIKCSLQQAWERMCCYI